MPFTSTAFVLFAVGLIIAYYIIHPKLQWVLLLAASYVFYMWNTPRFALFLLFSTFTTWAFSLFIGKREEKLEKDLYPDHGEIPDKETKKLLRKRAKSLQKLILIICLVCNLGVLVFLKYSNFFIRIVNLFGLQAGTIGGLIMPLGISFYTFQSIGYCVDVYRGVVKPEQNFFKYALYVSFFPQISQGPIGRYTELAPQLYKVHSFDYSRFVSGLERMLLGFFKKIVVADQLAIFVNSVYSVPNQYDAPALCAATLLYAFQLYADFSGYMDIALGMGECLGIKLAENFDTPYFSRSIAQFWRRWHISLSSWFRDYLYYSVLRSDVMLKFGKKLSGSGRKKAAKILTTSIGLFVTWLLIGLWHGAALKYIAHGLFHGTIIILSTVLADFYSDCTKKLHINEESRLWKCFQTARTFFLVCVGYVLFRSESLRTAVRIYERIVFGFFSTGGIGIPQVVEDKIYWLTAGVALLVFVVIDIIDNKKGFLGWLNSRRLPIRWALLYVMILALGCHLLFADTKAAGAGNFMYFDF